MTALDKDVKEGGDNFDEDDNSVESEMENCLKIQALARFQNLPASVKRRVKSLKKILYNQYLIESEFYREILEIEKKYESKYQELYDKRKGILLGKHEPDDEECDWQSDGEELSELIEKQATVADVPKEDDLGASVDDGSINGIPDFWYQTLSNVSLIGEMITEADQPILKHLEDVQCQLNTGEEAGFTLDFFFSKNEFFTNDKLTKQYFFKYDPPRDSTLDYEGPEIVRTKGCVINWKPNKNVTVKVIKKIKKHKNRKEIRSVTKTIKEDSFFNFFDPQLDNLDDDLDEETEELLHADFKIAQFIRESLISRAVLFFTGEGLEADFDDDYDEDEDSDDELDEEDAEEGDDSDEASPKQPKHANRAKKGGHAKGAVGEQPECKQS